MPKRISTILLFTVVIAIVALFAHTEVSAKVCVMYLGRTCIFWSGSVEGELTANELGDIIAEPKFLILRITPGIDGRLYCKRPDLDDPIPKTVTLKDDQIINEIVAKVTIKRGDIHNGTANVRARANLNQSQLNGLDKDNLCGDPTWKAIDFVPKAFEAQVSLKEKRPGSEDLIDEVIFKCDLPTYKTLGWEGNRPEQRPYTCRKIK